MKKYSNFKRFIENSIIVSILFLLIYGVYTLVDRFYLKIYLKTVETDNIDENIIIKPVKINTTEVNIAEANTTQVVVNKTEDKIEILKIFLKNTKEQINSQIIRDTNLSSDMNLSNKLKFKVTILKDGNYERLQYISGDKELFNKNKDNILTVFPVHIADEIKDQFPRYFRMDIK
jgi:hypothetical protein